MSPRPGHSIALTFSLAASLLALACTSDEPRYESIDDVAGCDPERPDFPCLQALFLPLLEQEWPFDRDRVARAYVPGGFHVLPGWKLTALHVIEGIQMGMGECYTGGFEFAEPQKRIEIPGCGSFLFKGGHSTALECQARQDPLAYCVDLVPIAEAWDIGLVASPEAEAFLEVRDDVRVGEEVFLVGVPSFLLYLDEEQLAWFDARYPLVSSGRVLAIDGRSIVISALAFPGNSGGPVLDRDGKAVGVAYTKISDVRSLGVATDASLEGHRTVAVRIDSEMKARIEAERSALVSEP